MSIQRPKWISRYMDGELPLPRKDQIARELETSAEARRIEADFEAIGERLRETPVPEARPAEAVWADVHRAIPQMKVYEKRTDRNICVFRLRRVSA